MGHGADPEAICLLPEIAGPWAQAGWALSWELWGWYTSPWLSLSGAPTLEDTTLSL